MALGENFEPILGAARTGEEWAWARLYEEMAPAVLGYLRAQRATDPEDLLGEVFLHLVRSLDSFAGDERGFRSWIFTIAHNRTLDAARKRGRPVSTISLDDGPAEAVHPIGNAESEAIRKLEANEVLEVLDRLSEDQRTVMTLRIFTDLPLADIANLLGKTEGAVKALQHRATTALRTALSLEGVTG